MPVKVSGNFNNINKMLSHAKSIRYESILDKYGRRGVDILERNTPKDTGKTSESWFYEITNSGKSATLTFYNSNVTEGVNIAIILDSGHGTRSGAYVQGYHYIRPSIRKALSELVDDLQKEIRNG